MASTLRVVKFLVQTADIFFDFSGVVWTRSIVTLEIITDITAHMLKQYSYFTQDFIFFVCFLFGPTP